MHPNTKKKMIVLYKQYSAFINGASPLSEVNCTATTNTTTLSCHKTAICRIEWH